MPPAQYPSKGKWGVLGGFSSLSLLYKAGVSTEKMRQALRATAA
jgi:hypothetical protein